MSWFGFSSGPAKIPDNVPAPDRDRELVLYKYDACGYCRRVMGVISKHGLDVEMRDTLMAPENRKALFEATGRTQVPCLLIDGEPLFESAVINAWLEAYASRESA